MTEKFDIKKAREICEMATPGPWVVDDRWELETAEEIDIDGEGGRILAIPDCEEDAALMAEARTLLPAALDRIEELEGRIKKQGKIINDLMHGNCPCRQEKTERIAELERALVEERTWFLAAEDGHHLEDLSELVSFPGEKSRYEYSEEAREQLEKEGLL